MKNAVIYARYSSDKQNEQSIDGQVKDCREWAKCNDVKVIHIYHDEALTGRTDKRPAFQRMIQDAKNGKFDYILVWKIDRFARNRYDSAIYKSQLKKHGVKVISVKENIADGPEGIILESVLEGMAEYFSANLSQNVLRGMRQNVEEGKYIGGYIPLGYKIDKEKRYIIDPDSCAIVKKIYAMYSSGHSMKEICQVLNSSGHKSATGKKFTYDSVRRILTNKKYIGEFESMGISLSDVIPAIIDRETFDTVQRKITKNKKAPASAKSPINFLLTGKLFCGHCGNSMVGDSGTSSTKATHYYYSCLSRKRKKGCSKKSVRKEWLENLIVDITLNEVLTDDNISLIAKMAFELHEQERADKSELTALKNSLNETQKIIDNIMNAIEQGIITPTTKKRLTDAENRKADLLAVIAREEIEKPTITREQIEFYLRDIKNNIYNSEEYNETIINTFINAVYLYDDKITITYNYKENNELKKVQFSELEKFGFNSDRCTNNIYSMRITMENIKDFINQNKNMMYSTLAELCAIPAPSHQEHLRAEYCKKFFENIGGTNAYIDDALNVIFQINCDNSSEITVFAAHTDTVFPDMLPMPYVDDGEKIFCPGVSDDTASVVTLLYTAKYFIENNIIPDKGVMFVCNSCEEGLGNLKGTKKLFEDFNGRIKQFITFDSQPDVIADSCVGSHRYEVEVQTSGGHSFGAFGNKNSIAELSKIVSQIYSIQVPQRGNSVTTYNVGTIEGGTSVNTIAQSAKMLCEYRSDNFECLAQMKSYFNEIFTNSSSDDVKVNVTLVGERPCANIDVKKIEELKSIVVPIIENVIKTDVKTCCMSTDCNVPLSLGVAALCIGVNAHGGIHTREEWLDKASMLPGLEVGIKIALTLTA